jgi:hypothetical protein
MWENYTSTGCISKKITSTRIKDNFSRREEIPRSTRRPIYTIAKTPESILKTTRRSRTHQ